MGEGTVGRILAYWEGRGRVERVASYLARRGGGKARGRPRRPYACRKPRGYKVLAPGDLSKIAPSGLTQVDTLTVTLGPGEVVGRGKVRASPVATAVGPRRLASHRRS